MINFTQFIVPKEFIHTGHKKQCKHNNLFIMHMLRSASIFVFVVKIYTILEGKFNVSWLDYKN